jgi:hypothetical protein
LQEIYISGALDAVSTISVPAQVATAKFYNDCVVKKQIKAHDIVEDMKVILRSRPELYPPAGYGCTIAGTDKVWGTPILSELGDTLRAGSAQKKDRRKAVLLFSFAAIERGRFVKKPILGVQGRLPCCESYNGPVQCGPQLDLEV